MFKKPQSGDDMMKWVIGGTVGLMAVGLGFFVWSESKSALQPKEVTQKDQAKTIADQGRDHVQVLSGRTYKSNPPTSGPHFPLWAKRGVYDHVLSDGFLIHSLEHGYVVLSYNCGPKGAKKDSFAYAANDPLAKLEEKAASGMQPFTPDTAPKAVAALPKAFSSDSCQQLTDELSMFLKEYHRIVVVPRPSLDTQIAVTAWNKIDKMDRFDEERIRAFIAAYHNKGPEVTAE